MKDSFIRNTLYFGEEMSNKLSKIKVAIVGVGGVGSYAAEALVRLGVQDFILIDNDTVDITNINRQIIALSSTVGKRKTSIMKERILDINKNAKVKEYPMFFNKENSNILINEQVDYVIDAIDTIACKVELIKVCLNNNINFISSMGMGNKEDLTKLEITTLDKTSYDPVAKKVRELAKKENLNMKKINVVFSREIPKKQNKIINNEGKTLKENCPPSSIIFTPSVAGFLCAYYVYNSLK